MSRVKKRRKVVGVRRRHVSPLIVIAASLRELASDSTPGTKKKSQVAPYQRQRELPKLYDP